MGLENLNEKPLDQIKDESGEKRSLYEESNSGNEESNQIEYLRLNQILKELKSELEKPKKSSENNPPKRHI